MAENRNWYVAVRGEQRGPMSSEELRSLATTGAIDRSCLVWADGMPDWAEAGSVKGLFVGPPPMHDPKPRQQTEKQTPPQRPQIEEYEIVFDRKKMLLWYRMILLAALIPVILFSLSFVLVILGVGDAGPWVMIGPILLVAWPICWTALTNYCNSLKYSIVNDVLTVKHNLATTRIPLAKITDVRIVTLKDREKILVQTSGSPRPEATLQFVLDPEAVSAMLLSKQS